MIWREGLVSSLRIPGSRSSKAAASLKYAMASPKTETSRTAVNIGTPLLGPGFEFRHTETVPIPLRTANHCEVHRSICRKKHPYTLNLKLTTSPSRITYSFPSLRTKPAERNASIERSRA